MSDRLASHVRTYWPMLLGHLTALLTAWVAARLGFELDSALVYELLALGLSGLVYAAGRWLEEQPARWARTLGRWLLSLGLDVGPPSYRAPDGPGANVGGRR